MDIRALATAVLMALAVLLGGGFVAALQPAQPASQRVSTFTPTSARPAFPPAPTPPPQPVVAKLAPATPPPILDREIASLGRGGHFTDPFRDAFEQAADLRRFSLELLPAAQAGDGAAQYHVYLALEQCVIYLRPGVEEARAMFDEQLLELADAGPSERARWEREYHRCREFSGGGVEPIAAALGDQRPGAANEYASVWFERSADAGYPQAQAERALRTDAYSLDQRRAWLAEAAAGGDPWVYWTLQAYASSADPPERALAWLIVACRAGLDCSEDAQWYQPDCEEAAMQCQRGESALEHDWFALPAHERFAAWALAMEIEGRIAQGRFEELPWPSLAN